MAKKGSSTPPPAPNPVAVAGAQTDSNINTAIAQALLNSVNQITPFGSSTTTPTGAINVGGNLIPQFTTRTTLNPLAQEQLDLQQQLGIDLTQLGSQGVDLIGSALGQGIDLSALPSLSTDFSGDANAATDAIFGRVSSLLDPQFQRQRDALELELSERGIPLGSEIYNNLTEQLSTQHNEALSGAALDAVLAGQSRQSDLFGQNLAGRQQGFQEQSFLNSLPFNQVAALLGSAPGIPTPQFNPFTPTGVAGTDVIGAHLGSAQLAQNNFALQQQSRSGLLGGLFGLAGNLGSAAILASDRNAKKDFREAESVLDKVKSLQVERWKYKGDDKEHIGPMAQDFSERFGGDTLSINLGDANGVVIKAIQELAEKVEALENE